MILQRLSEAFYFWRRHLGALFLITAPFAVLGEAVQWVLGPYFITNQAGQLASLNLAAMVVSLLIRPLAEGALVMQLASIHNGHWRGLVACVLPALALYPLLLVTYFIVSLGMSIGLMLLVLPAFWVYARLGFAPFRVMLNREGPLTALRGAFRQSASCQWPLLLTIVLAGGLVFSAMGLLSSLIVGVLGENAGSLLITALLAGLATSLVNVVVFRFWLLASGDTTPA